MGMQIFPDMDHAYWRAIIWAILIHRLLVVRCLDGKFFDWLAVHCLAPNFAIGCSAT
jgi:hypothetical protein